MSNVQARIDARLIEEAYERSRSPAVTYFAIAVVILGYRFNSEHFGTEFAILSISMCVVSIARVAIGYVGLKRKESSRALLPFLKVCIVVHGVLWGLIFGLVAYDAPIGSIATLVAFTLLTGISSAVPTSLIAMPYIQPFFLVCVSLLPFSVYAYLFFIRNQPSAVLVLPLLMVIYFFYSIVHSLQLRQMLIKSLENMYGLQIAQDDLLREKAKTEELLTTVQAFFLPEKPSLRTAKFSLCGHFAPAAEASGDWWWYDSRGDEVTILLGDVTGHGAASAMLTASTASQLQMLKRMNPDITVDDVLTALNQEFSATAKGEFMMTMSAIQVGPALRLRWWNAAAPPLFLLRRSGKIEQHLLSSDPLGLSSYALAFQDFELSSGDRVFLYTDGLSELMLPKGKVIRSKQLMEIFQRTQGMSVADAVAFIAEQIDTLRDGEPLRDDVTFVLLDCH